MGDSDDYLRKLKEAQNTKLKSEQILAEKKNYIKNNIGEFFGQIRQMLEEITLPANLKIRDKITGTTWTYYIEYDGSFWNEATKVTQLTFYHDFGSHPTLFIAQPTVNNLKGDILTQVMNDPNSIVDEIRAAMEAIVLKWLQNS
jgi:hypothetical protein